MPRDDRQPLREPDPAVRWTWCALCWIPLGMILATRSWGGRHAETVELLVAIRSGVVTLVGVVLLGATVGFGATGLVLLRRARRARRPARGLWIATGIAWSPLLFLLA